MLIIGLTGGIGSGKTAAANLFADLGVPVIDTDIIARELVMPGSPAHAQIVAAFGQTILQADGNLDRQKLRQIVFSSSEQREQLEAILHPLIREQVQQEISALAEPYCIVVIPLLIEKHQHYAFIDRVLVIDLPEELQIQRSCGRDNTSVEEIRKIINTQCDRDTRLAAADDIIENSGSLEQLKISISQLHQKYLALAQSLAEK